MTSSECLHQPVHCKVTYSTNVSYLPQFSSYSRLQLPNGHLKIFSESSNPQGLFHAVNQPATINTPMMSSSTIHVDPTAPGTLIRRLMFLEGTLNLLGAVPLLLFPTHLLQNYFCASAADATASAATLLQWIGALFIGMTPQLFLALPNSRYAIESRRTVYWTLGAGEAALVPLLLWQAAKSAAATGPVLEMVSEKAGFGVQGLSTKVLIGMAVMLGMPMVGRAYVLFWRPELFGRYKEVGKRE